MTRNWAVLLGITCLLSTSTLVLLPLGPLPAPTAVAQAPDSRKIEADQLLQQGLEQFKTSQFEAALQSWQQALILYRQIKDRWGEGAALGNLGIAYQSLGNYPRAIEYLEQQLVIAREIKNRQSESNALGNLGLAYYALGNYPRAIEYLEQQLVMAREIKDRLGEGNALGNLGLAYQSLGNYPKAIEYQEQSLAIARNIKDRRGEGAALGNLGLAYQSLGNYPKAIEYQEQQLAIAREIKNRQSESNALGNLGISSYFLGNYPRAIEYLEQQLVMARAIKDRRGEGNALGNLGLAYQSLGNYPRAIEYQEQRLAIAREIKDRRGEGAALGNLGIAYYSLGNYSRAIEYLEQQLVMTRAIKDRQGEGAALGSLGLAYQFLGNYSRAIEYQEQRLAIAREIKDRRGEGAALGNLGLAYYSLRNYSKAIEYQEQSLAITREVKDRLGEGNALGNLGLTYQFLGNYSKAIEYQEQSLAITREVKDRLGEGNALGNLGLSYQSLGNYSRAIEYQEQSLAIARNIKDRHGEGVSLHNLGVIRFQAGKLAQAEQDLYQAIAVYESLREQLQDADKVSIADTQRNPYNTLQRVLIAQNKVESALEIAERGRARAFSELLAKRTQGKQTSAIQPLPITAIKQIAKAQNATLVQYANIYNEQLLIYVIQPSGAVAVRQVDLKRLKQQNTSLDHLIMQARCLGVGTCEQQIADRGRQPLAFNQAQTERLLSLASTLTLENQYLQQLHALLIEPVTDLLPQNPSDRVIFLPQEALFLVPFAALQNPKGDYLIDRHTLTVAPSIQVLQLTRQQRQRLGSSPQGSLLLVGNPLMPKLTIPGRPPTQLTSLPGAEREVKTISKLLQVPALIGAQATKSFVLKQMSQSRIIHLATHGLLDDFGGGGVPGAIALAPDKPGEPNSGLLTANELLDLKLQAELVVLSACDTGRGRITGDGVIGLSRSLITAGVPSVIVSLWAVPDAPTADLMSRFYQNLQQGQDKATALRQAMLDTRKQHPNPIAWASFVLIGEAQ